MRLDFDVVVIGAGPYGLAASAHLRKLPNLNVKTFGLPMDFWKNHMPEGMLLRSPWDASHISDPNAVLTIDSFVKAIGAKVPVPIPLDQFVEYGLWFQSKAVPEVDTRSVKQISRESQAFKLTLNDNSECRAGHVVVAAGIGSFARRPQEFKSLPHELVNHSSDKRSVRTFSGKRIAVIGAGQSALESAALMHEAGADVEVIARSSHVHWLGWKARLQKLGPIGKLLYSPYDIGPAGVSRIVAVPNLVRCFPRRTQDYFRRRALRPAGARWLVERCRNIRITTGRAVTSATERSGRLVLRLDDDTSREVDRVLLGTGYRVEISQYPFLSSELSRSVEQVNGFPKLNTVFESSVKGLYFLGAPAAWMFGPLMYFVCGTGFAARTLTRHFATNGARRIP